MFKHREFQPDAPDKDHPEPYANKLGLQGITTPRLTPDQRLEDLMILGHCNEESEQCPQCGGYNTNYHRVRDHPLYGDVDYWECEECDHQFGGDLD